MNLRSLLMPLTLALTLGLVYALTLAPGLAWTNFGADGGDLIAAAHSGGVAHPTGYPLYLLLAKAALLIPLGEPALRTNLLSALLTIFAAITTLSIARALGASPIPAWIAALGLGLAPAIWGQAVITEVYPLHLLLCAILFWQALRTPAPSNLARGIVLGLALSNHITSLFLIPLLAITNGEFRPQPAPILRRAAWALATAAFFYATLVLRASANPPINWGNPQNIAGLLWLIRGGYYGGYLRGNPAELLNALFALGQFIQTQLGYPALFLAAYGILTHPHQRALRLLTLLLLLALGGFTIFYHTADGLVYLFPVILLAWVWAGVGLSTLISRQTGRWANLFALLLVASLVIQARAAWPQVDASQDTRPREFANEIFTQAPKNAILFTAGDRDTLTLWYYQHVRGERPDAVIIAIGLLEYDWYAHMLSSAYPGLVIPDQSRENPNQYTRLNPTRPRCDIFAEPVTGILCTSPEKP